MTASAPPSSSERDVLHRLGERRNGPALLRLSVQSLALGVLLPLSAQLAAAEDPLWWLAASLSGVAVLMFFPLLHESGHQTAFASPFLNELGVWLGALAMGQAPTFFREFHWEHHRSTQNPETDPEISALPDFLDGWPSNPLTYLGLVTGQYLLLGKLGFTTLCALTPASFWTVLFPFVRADRRRRLAWESRLAIALIVGFVGLGLQWIPGFAFALVAWPIAHVFLGLYLMAEHTGLANEGTQFDRTRSVRSNALLRWIMWNMPYHSEHHAHPGVPFHALPALHKQVASQLVHTKSGYLRFQLEAFRHAFHLS